MNKQRSEDLVLQDIAAMDVLLSHPEYFEKRAAISLMLYQALMAARCDLSPGVRLQFPLEAIYKIVGHARFLLASEQLAVETETEVELPQSPQEPRES